MTFCIEIKGALRKHFFNKYYFCIFGISKQTDVYVDTNALLCYSYI